MVESPTALPEGAVCATHDPEPAVFVCGRCGTFACAACAFDAERRHCRACGERPVDWERWRERGVVASFFTTTRALLFEPTRFYRQATAAATGPVPALAYGTVAFTVAQLAYLGYAVVAVLGFGAFGADSGPELGAMAGIVACASPLVLIQAPIQAAIGAVWSAGWSHLTLRLLGKRDGTFEQTLRAISYANAPYVLWVVPCVGWILPFVWVPVLEIIALRETHRVGTEIALVAVLGHRIVFVLLIVGSYAALVALIMAAAR